MRPRIDEDLHRPLALLAVDGKSVTATINDILRRHLTLQAQEGDPAAVSIDDETGWGRAEIDGDVYLNSFGPGVESKALWRNAQTGAVVGPEALGRLRAGIFLYSAAKQRDHLSKVERSAD